MGDLLIDLLQKIDKSEGVTADEMSQLIWPLINITKAAGSLLVIVSQLSEAALNSRDEKEIRQYIILREAIDQLAHLQVRPSLDS